VRDGLLGARESRAGIANPNARDVLGDVGARVFPEQAVKRRHTERRHIRERLQRQFLCVVLVYVRQDSVDSLSIVALWLGAPAVRWCAAYLLPIVPATLDFEVDFTGRATAADLTDLGRAQMGW
jgi:hypothetical protein